MISLDLMKLKSSEVRIEGDRSDNNQLSQNRSVKEAGVLSLGK